MGIQTEVLLSKTLDISMIATSRVTAMQVITNISLAVNVRG